MASIFERFGKPGLVIVGEIVESLRFKRASSPSTPTGVFPVGQSGYNPATITGAPSNLSSSGFYTVKNINVGITDVETAVELIRQSASDSTFSSYNNLSMVSLDGLFVPYSVDPNHSGLPHFNSVARSGVATAKTLNPFDPNNSLSSGSLQTGMPNGIEGRWLRYGHNIGIALSKTASDTGVTDLNFEKDYYNTAKVEKDTVRSVGFRTPMVLSGMGFSVSGTPVPNSGSQFHPEAYWNPVTWKTGPVDFRWDEYFGTWGGPNIMMGIAKTNFTAASGIFSPASGTVCRYVADIPASTGYIVGQCTAYVHDSTLGVINSGTIVYFNNVDGYNKIFYAACSADSGALQLLTRWSG